MSELTPTPSRAAKSPSAASLHPAPARPKGRNEVSARSTGLRDLPHEPHPRRLRVLFLVNRAQTVGGAERFVTGLASHLPQDEIETWVCSTRRSQERAVRMLEQGGVRHICLGRTKKWQLHRFLPLISLLRRERFDVLHANMFGSNVWGTLIGRACRVPVVIAHEHTWSFADDRLRMWIDRHVIGRLSTAFVAVSSADRSRMIELERVPPEKVVVMPYPRLPHDEPADGGDIRSELGIAPGVPLVAVAAVMRRQKALHVMLDAHHLLLEQVPDAHLVIAGDGPCRRELEAQIDRLGTGMYVHLVGVRDDIDGILRVADAAAMSSDFEGTPLFALECMAAGTPLVATAVGGLPDLITHEETGLLVPPRDPAALAAALERVLTDTRLAEHLASAAAASSDEFTVESVVKKFAALYEELVAKAGIR
jgi:glycosyltransferase involved in cell wall biosynthesis